MRHFTSFCRSKKSKVGDHISHQITDVFYSVHSLKNTMESLGERLSAIPSPRYDHHIVLPGQIEKMLNDLENQQEFGVCASSSFEQISPRTRGRSSSEPRTPRLDLGWSRSSDEVNVPKIDIGQIEQVSQELMVQYIGTIKRSIDIIKLSLKSLIEILAMKKSRVVAKIKDTSLIAGLLDNSIVIKDIDKIAIELYRTYENLDEVDWRNKDKKLTSLLRNYELESNLILALKVIDRI
jgi:hypothetical protein